MRNLYEPTPRVDPTYLKLAKERFAWPGGYEIFFVTDDSGILCSPCVDREWFEVIRDSDPGDGWRVIAYDHDGNLDESVTCDHCYREIGGDGSETEMTETEMTETEIRDAWRIGASYRHLANLTGLTTQKLVAIVNATDGRST